MAKVYLRWAKGESGLCAHWNKSAESELKVQECRSLYQAKKREVCSEYRVAASRNLIGFSIPVFEI